MGLAVRCAVTVANTGSVPLSGLKVRGVGGEETVFEGELAPGETRQAELAHTVVRQDAIDGYLCWAASAEAVPAEGEAPVAAQSAPLIVPIRAE